MITVVSNTGPLIALARINKLDLIKRYFDEIRIPREVYEEICIRGKERPGSKEVKDAKWIRTIEVRDKFAVELLLKGLNKGEAETVVLAKELNASLVLMDERIPRETLELLGFSITGTVGILIRAANDGLIGMKESLDGLRKKGFWMSDELYSRALRMGGEK
ncbi:MAG: DUF3368 domain-containing protein [Halobacteriota archaeon]